MARPRTATVFIKQAVAALLFTAATPVLAQEAPIVETDSDVFDGDFLILGVGALSLPTYEGSDNNRIIPAAGARGELGGIGFSIRGPSLSLDLLRDHKGQKVGLRFGPQVRLRSNRSSKVGDEVVARLGTLDKVIEGGFRAGVNVKELVSKADSLSIGVSARWDLSGKGSGRIVSPSVSYVLPVSRAQVFGFQLGAQFIDDKYADYNYTVTAEGAALSGLPAYQAKGGLKEINVGIATARDLGGDFLDGGFSIGAGLIYSRLYGSAARTPITAIRGDRDQWFFGGGLAYTF